MNNNFPEIIFENDHCLVINKPAGLVVHEGGNVQEKTLADFLLEKYPEIKDVGDSPIRPGIVHRLDREVNGLMVVAKTQESFNNLKTQFQNRTINKGYTALVYGQLSKDYDVINFPIKRASSGHKMAAMPLNTEELLVRKSPKGRDRGNIEGVFKSKEAITEFEVLKRLINYTLVKVKIKTGRTHQIRVHFSAYGHPLVGDNLYGTKKTKERNKKIDLGRVFLVAKDLSFTDTDGEKRSFSIEMPKDLEERLKELK